jgi:hypothetical protein
MVIIDVIDSEINLFINNKLLYLLLLDKGFCRDFIDD